MRILRVLTAVLLMAGLASAQQSAKTETKEAATKKTVKRVPSFDLDAFDKTADPCEDFYQYACGGWVKSNPVPADQTRWGRFDELRENGRAVLRDILEEQRANNKGRSASEQKIGDYYDACMDESGIEKAGLKPLQPWLKRIDGAKDKVTLLAQVAALHDAGVNVLFGFGTVPQLKNSKMNGGWADQAGLGLPNRDYYFKDDAKSVETRTQYVQHVQNMLQLSGIKADAAAGQAKAIMELETALAKVSMAPVQRRDLTNLDHWTKRADFTAMTPSFAWDKYFDGIGAPAFTELNVANPEFFPGLEQAIQSTDLATLKSYFRWQLVNANSDVLPKRFQDESFDFFQKKLNGAKENQARWKRCTNYVSGDLGEALGEIYVREAFGGNAKERVNAMVDSLIVSMEKDINEIDWMGAETKKEAHAKLASFRKRMGYPDKWRDYSALQIKRGDALGNSMRSNAFENRRQLKKIGTEVDKSEWPYPPQTVNASYSSLMNMITFPAGILQPPFFDNNIDDAVNFGAIGIVIGHEITHGFDDSGRKTDASGSLRDWWTEEDNKKFEERAQCVADQYSDYVVVDDLKLNGKLTLGENVADNGGARISYMAWQDTVAKSGKKLENIDGFTPEQRFFIGYAQVWCQNVTPERARTLQATDPHSPGQFRTIGVVSNSPEFAKAFGCKQGQKMVRENACRVW